MSSCALRGASARTLTRRTDTHGSSVVAHVGDLHPADAARTVRADEEFAPDLLLDPGVVGEHDARLVGGDVNDLVLADAKADITAIALAGIGEVNEHVVLRVEPYRLPERAWKSMRWLTPAEAKVDASVLMAFGQYPVRHPGFNEEPDAVAFEDAGPHGLLDLAPGAVVDDDRIDPA